MQMEDEEPESVDLNEMPVFRAELWEENAAISHVFYKVLKDGKVKFTCRDLGMENTKHASLVADTWGDFIEFVCPEGQGVDVVLYRMDK
jgi:hypothetical protein